MKVNYIENGKRKTFKTRPGFDLKIDAFATGDGICIGEAIDGYFIPEGKLLMVFGTHKARVSNIN